LSFWLVRETFFYASVEGESMAPTLEQGEHILGSGSRLFYTEAERGDVVVFRAWDSDSQSIKRVIGLPGEEINLRDGAVFIDGVEINEPYVSQPAEDDMGPIQVFEEEYFVLSDNREESGDSREYGPLPKNLILGRALWVYAPTSHRRSVGHYPLRLPTPAE
jgi:signal peptidase I